MGELIWLTISFSIYKMRINSNTYHTESSWGLKLASHIKGLASCWCILNTQWIFTITVVMFIQWLKDTKFLILKNVLFWHKILLIFFISLKLGTWKHSHRYLRHQPQGHWEKDTYLANFSQDTRWRSSPLRKNNNNNN